MKKIYIIFLSCIFSLLTSAVTLAEPAWEISIQEWDCAGSYDFFLYYPNSSQVISKIILPQDQRMAILNVKYHLPKDHGFIKLQYGGTGMMIKGRGSDSDWTTSGSNTLTDYGELDAYGDQQLFAIDFGKTFVKNDHHTISAFVGWGQQESANEFKNIIYYLSDGAEVINGSQADNGTSLDIKFNGVHLGIDDQWQVGPKVILTTRLTVSLLDTEADGHWANYTPARNWTSTGNTFGYTANLGLKHAFSKHIQSELGYLYNYAKSTDCKVAMNGVSISQLSDQRYEQKGIYFGLNFLF